ELTRLDPEAAAGWALRGLCEFRTRQYDLAREHLKRAHTLTTGGGELRRIADYHLALLLIREGAFELSFEILVKVARMAKNDPEIAFACGLAALRMAVLPEEVAPADRDVVAVAGKAFFDLATRPPAESKAAFDTLLGRYPEFPNVHYFYGTYLAVHRPDDAIPEFLKELQVSPQHVPARVQLALQHLSRGETEQALKWAAEAASISPDSVGTRLAFGRALMNAGKEEAALAEFLKAKELDPASPEIRMYAVSAYRALGRKEEMLREQNEFERLKALQKNWP
ncbi:MAG TPA: tetratricopeptide repeat protein, partial [Bryobacteraceae bacterium]|nr:tetratricopeptide repeat protein [Bryobacteraceae bacterium]